MIKCRVEYLDDTCAELSFDRLSTVLRVGQEVASQENFKRFIFEYVED